jgi:hypothetical protein
MNSTIYHTLALTKIRRRRTFSGDGDILVKVGQKVSPTDIVAKSYPNQKFIILNIRKLLNLNNTEDARRAINSKVGDKLKSGDTIAGAQNMFSKAVQAPEDSEVFAISGSQIVLRVLNDPELVYAGFEAIVVELLPEQGAILENNGVLLQGVWGNQKIGSGLLVSITDSPQQELIRGQLGIHLRGSILLGGYCRDPEILKLASEFPLKGLILSGIHPDLVSETYKLQIPVILLEGFYPTPLNLRAFNLLKSNEKREVTINAVYKNEKEEKPEIIIPVNAEGNLPSGYISLKSGVVVRVNNGIHKGRAANFERIIKGNTSLNNGVKTICALVNFDEEEQAQIPLANLDILE